MPGCRDAKASGPDIALISKKPCRGVFARRFSKSLVLEIRLEHRAHALVIVWITTAWSARHPCREVVDA